MSDTEKEIEHLQASLDAEIKSWEKVVNYVNDGSGYDDEGNWIPDIVLRRLKDYDRLKAKQAVTP
jgi:hypothetical protein